MSTRRVPVVLVALITLTMSAACDKTLGGNPASPSNVDVSVMFVDEGPRFSPGVYPAPVFVNGATYVYVNTGTDGVPVQASSDGLNFAPVPASYPAGVTRTIVSLPDGRFRMYYFSDATSSDVRSAVSSNGLNWTVESGIRYSDPGMAGMRAVVLPTGGYRLYYGNAGTTQIAMSNDGLAFTAEGAVNLVPPAGTATWGALGVASLGSRFHMIVTRFPISGSAELWHAVSADGRNWTVDRNALAVNPGVPLSQPEWCITGILRIYYRAANNVIGSGIVKVD